MKERSQFKEGEGTPCGKNSEPSVEDGSKEKRILGQEFFHAGLDG